MHDIVVIQKGRMTKGEHIRNKFKRLNIHFHHRFFPLLVHKRPTVTVVYKQLTSLLAESHDKLYSCTIQMQTKLFCTVISHYVPLRITLYNPPCTQCSIHNIDLACCKGRVPCNLTLWFPFFYISLYTCLSIICFSVFKGTLYRFYSCV